MESLAFRGEDTKSGAPLELPVTRQLAAILERRRAECTAPGDAGKWVFPTFGPGALGHIEDLAKFHGPIGEAAGTRFQYHGLRATASSPWPSTTCCCPMR